MSHELDDIVERFEDAWQRGGRPDIGAHLPLNGQRRGVLIELVHVDLERRVKSGEAVRVESYLRQFPELAEPAILQDLVAAEFSLRRRRDPDLTAAEYGERFPEVPAATLSATPGAHDRTGTAAHARVVTETGYDELRLHAQGGLGAVFVARDDTLNREVALKFLKHSHAADVDGKQRFLREAEITGRLEHPGVVPVYGVGRDANGQPVYAMRFIRGQTLQEALDAYHRAAPTLRSGQRRIEFRQLLTRLVSVCQTIAFAHTRGVIHRDLKPGNILLGEFGETIVADWGLACAELGVGSAECGVEGEEIVGTPAYMSPEQALGKAIGRAGDVFGLGALLYALLTGRAPYRAASVLETWEQAKRGEFEAPRRVNRGVPRPLDAVCRQAMALDPASRYASAMDIATDLEHWLAGEPVSAWREPMAVWAKRWIGRHAAFSASVTVALIAGAILIGVAAVLHADKRVAEQQRDQGQKELAQREQNDYRHRIANAGRAWLTGNRASATQQLDGCAPALRGWEWHHLQRCLDGAPRELGRHAAEAWAVAYSPDGQRLASAGLEGAVFIWNLATPDAKPLALPKNDKPVHTIAFHPDGRRLATAGEDFIIHVWDTTTLREVQSFELQGEVLSVAFSRDGKRIAAGTVPGFSIGRPRQGKAVVWDFDSGDQINDLGGHANGVHAVAFAPDGRLATGGMDGLVKLWDVDARKSVQIFRGHRFRIHRLAFSPDGALLASSSGDGSVAVWDVALGARKHFLLGHRDMVWGIAFSPDGERLFSSGDDKAIREWDVRRGRLLRTLRGHTSGIANIAARPDGKQLASAGDDQTVRLWNLEAGNEATVLAGHDDVIHALAISSDGALSASASEDKTVRVWDMATQRQREVIRLDSPATAVAFQPGGTILAIATADGIVRYWDVAARRESRVWPAHRAAVWALAFSGDGQSLASASQDGFAIVWNVASGHVERRLEGKGQMRAVTFSPDGAFIAAGGDDRTVRIWYRASGEIRHEFSGLTSEVRGLAFSPDGRTLAVATDRTSRVVSNEPGQVRLYDVESGEERLTLTGHWGGTTGVSFMPDGKRFISTGGDGAVKIWDTTGQELLPLPGHVRPATALAITPDGQRVLTAGQDGTIIVRHGP